MEANNSGIEQKQDQTNETVKNCIPCQSLSLQDIISSQDLQQVCYSLNRLAIHFYVFIRLSYLLRSWRQCHYGN
jgi:hypothetical protein